MRQTKYLAFAIALVFLAGLIWSAQAQTKITTLQAIEVSEGIVDSAEGEVYGCSFLGKTSGRLPGSFFMSMNYSYSSGPVTSILPPQPISLVDNMTGGTWSLPVYQYNRYLGAIYGHVAEGTVQWKDGRGTVGAVKMTLMIDGGTRIFEGASGKGTFSGTLNHLAKDKPELSGTFSLVF